ncbi:hypothetical protein NDU88_001884 [Pleurodeles waltl]|uniref:Uncharacterized protein n=1 Tax=Pleurodeles waltl TaxID=8319 RepID=A0AAV7MLR4_PLEWA|nr:hypothetical protein NDU88_001884 [Pleurodeles waltl]
MKKWKTADMPFRKMLPDNLDQQALHLLRQTGRVDVVQESALAKTQPLRRAASGVAAAVWPCSPPRQRRNAEPQVTKGMPPLRAEGGLRRERWGAGGALSWARLE